VIAVHGNATIEGRITVSAVGSTPGSGAATCQTSPGGDTSMALDKGAGGGGAGGGFGGAGGAGGTGDGDPMTIAGGVASATIGDATLIPLRGGCPGGRGGQEHPGSDPAEPGAAGGGGGAIQLSVRDTLDIRTNASFEANGGGGGGAVNMDTNNSDLHVGAGGGGGGSGGAIFLEANTLQIAMTAILCANGGGGGSGSHEADNGTKGADGICSSTTAANGSTGGGNNGGDGGDGAFDITPAEVGGAGAGADGGGGGGGGGVGRIRVRAASGMAPSNFRSSPPAAID
jgi:hypothetical protein